jgi:hypothetical protein
MDLRDTLGALFYPAAMCAFAYCGLRCLLSRLRNDLHFGTPLLVARPKSTFWLCFGVVGIFSALSLQLISIVSPIGNAELWSGIGFCAFAIGALYTWLGSYQLRISESAIEYWSLFGGYRSLSQSQIDRAQIRTGWVTYQDRFRPLSRLEILPAAGSGGRLMVIGLKIFREKELNQVLNWLGPLLRSRKFAPIRSDG